MNKKPEVKYSSQLSSLVNTVYADAMLTLSPILISTEAQYVQDTYADEISSAMEDLKARWALVDGEAVARDFVISTNGQQKAKFYSGFSEMSLSLTEILGETAGTKSVGTLLQASVKENVNLIKDISQDSLNSIEKLVWSASTAGEGANDIIKRISALRGKDVSHAKFIARDQYAKLNGNLNRIRQTNLGVEEYIWVTVGDARVRQTHINNNGKIFSWDSPPPDTGHPGQDYQCRCIAQPILPK